MIFHLFFIKVGTLKGTSCRDIRREILQWQISSFDVPIVAKKVFWEKFCPCNMLQEILDCKIASLEGGIRTNGEGGWGDTLWPRLRLTFKALYTFRIGKKKRLFCSLENSAGLNYCHETGTEVIASIFNIASWSCKLLPIKYRNELTWSDMCAPAFALSLQHAFYAYTRRGLSPAQVPARCPIVCVVDLIHECFECH